MSVAIIKLKSSIYFILLFSISLLSITFFNNCSPDEQKKDSSVPKADTVKKTNEKPTQISYTVEIQGMKFVPEELKAHAGDTVVWINRDMVAHNVTEEVNKTWSSSVLKPDKSWQMIITKSSDYYCNIHTGMKGKIIVE